MNKFQFKLTILKFLTNAYSHMIDKSLLDTISSIRSPNFFYKYVGFLMIQGRTRKEYFNFVLDKLNSRLASLKNKLLDISGRVSLVSFVMNPIPSY